MKKRLFPGLLCLLLFVRFVSGQHAPAGFEHIKFQYLTTNEGLGQNTVVSILKDSRGFMWFGTWNGLSRFDGYSFKTYRSDVSPAGLPNNFVYTLCEDDAGTIWIGTGKGLARYVFEENRFEIPKNIEQIFSSFRVNDLKIDRHNRLWVATENSGIWIVDLNDQAAVRKLDDALLPNRAINCLHWADDCVLVGTDAGLGVVDADGTKKADGFFALQSRLRNSAINAILVDSRKTLWVGTTFGLYCQQEPNGAIGQYNHSPGTHTGLDHQAVRAIAEDASGQVIVGTYAGLNFYHPATNSFSHLSPVSLEKESLNSPFVNCVATDPGGNVWIGTDKGGVNHYNVHQKPFLAMVNDPANGNTISHNTINSILKEDHILWVGTAGGGLNKVTDRRVERIDLDKGNSTGVGNNFVTAIMRSSTGELWLGTWGAGLKRLSGDSGNRIESFIHVGSAENPVRSEFISSVTELSEHALLVGTESGLELFDPGRGRFTPVDPKMKLTGTLEVGCLLPARDGSVWIGSRNGLYRVKRADLEQFASRNEIPYTAWFNNPGDSVSLPGNYVISLKQTADGTIWVGTYGNGICRVLENPNGTIQFKKYTEDNGLCNNVAYAMEEDLQGNLWISTDKGLSKLDPKAGTFQNFFVKDGLLSDQFYWSASCADAAGNLYFGSIAGVNYFDASRIDIYRKGCKPVFTEFLVFNEPVKIGQKYHGRVILKNHISDTPQLELSYKDAVFSIEFSALDYFLPEKVRYQYKMEGVDQGWVEVPATRRFANYTNLSGGEYTFKVRAGNSDGVWSDETAELRIVVHPPFYNTAWFRFLSVVFLVLAVLGYIRYRTRFLKEQKRKLEEQVKERTIQIEAQKEKLEIQADRLQRTNVQLEERRNLIEGQKIELEQQNTKIAQQRDELIDLNEKVNLINQLRLRFFTNISHEFRTPLTLIIDPLEQLMENLHEDRATMNTLKIINRNARRLLHLINQLIYFRRLESGKMDLHVARGDLRQFLFLIFESFADLAHHQQIDYRFEAGELEAETWFDAEKMENIFYNLLSNAFKFTPVNGSIVMKVSRVGESGESDFGIPHLCIEVTDSGTGIEAGHLPFLFERFYQVRSEKNSGMKSSGIGLALTFELVQALHGRIDVESAVGKGSRFVVRLPYTADRFDERELDQSLVPVGVNLEGRVDVLTEHLYDVEMPEEPVEVEAETDESGSKPLVIIVEDNFDLRSFLLNTLRAEYRVIGAENGKDALALAKKYSPELILSDVMMPVMDGMELCSRLKKDIQTSHIPVILLTARTMVENWIEGLESGADDYVPKPFNMQVLQARMQNLVESRRKLKRMFSNPGEVPVDQLAANPLDREFLEKASAVLERSYRNPDFSASQFASEMFVSRSLLYKKIRAVTDLNITDFINSFKLKKSVELIRENKMPIADVAFKVGFNDPKYFSRMFRKFYGMSPSEFLSKE